MTGLWTLRILQETVNQLRAQLAQHEAAANTLQGAISAMQSKMEEATMRTPALKARRLMTWWSIPSGPILCH